MKLRLISNFKKRWKLLLLLFIIAGGVGYFVYQKSRPKIPQYTFIKPERTRLVKTLVVSGNIKAEKNALIRFAAGGKVTYLGAQEGDWVKKGQTIATIDQRTLQKNLEKSLNLYSKERIDWDRVLDNSKDRALPETELETNQKNQYDLTNTVIDVQLTSIAITNSVLSAPFDGVLVSSPTKVTGVTLSATDTFELVDPNSLYFEAQIDELDIAQVMKGQAASIVLDAYPDDKVYSNVQFIAYKSSQTSTSTVYLVHLPISPADLNRFRLGMNGDATVTLETKENALAIPLDATILKDGKTYVQVKTGENQVEDRLIQTGIETNDQVEVLEGLRETDEVVLPE